MTHTDTPVPVFDTGAFTRNSTSDVTPDDTTSDVTPDDTGVDSKHVPADDFRAVCIAAEALVVAVREIAHVARFHEETSEIRTRQALDLASAILATLIGKDN